MSKNSKPAKSSKSSSSGKVKTYDKIRHKYKKTSIGSSNNTKKRTKKSKLYKKPYKGQGK